MSRLKPTVIQFDLDKLLDIKHGDKASIGIFPDLLIEDESTHKEYEKKYTEIIRRANAYIEMCLFEAAQQLKKEDLALYCYCPFYQIQDNNKMLGEFYYYSSRDLDSEFHEDKTEEMRELLEEEGIFLHSVNISKFFELRIQ